MGGAATAGVLEDCYDNAKSELPAMEVYGWRSGSVVKSFTEVGPVMEWVARYHEDPTIGLTANAQGELAVKWAMTCLRSAKRLTLSAVFINQEFPAFRIQDHTLVVRDENGDIVRTYRFDSVRPSCDLGYDAVLAFRDEGGTESDYNIGVLDFGIADRGWAYPGAGPVAATTVCVSQVAEPCTNGSYGCGSPDANGKCTCEAGGGKCFATTSGAVWNMGGTGSYLQTMYQ